MGQSATIEKQIQRQITFGEKLYGQITDEADAENKRLNHVLRKEKIHIQDMVPLLVKNGLQFRRGEIYTPEDQSFTLSKDDRWVKLRAKAETALEDFLAYQNKLLAKEE